MEDDIGEGEDDDERGLLGCLEEVLSGFWCSSSLELSPAASSAAARNIADIPARLFEVLLSSFEKISMSLAQGGSLCLLAAMSTMSFRSGVMLFIGYRLDICG
jgi:hypothetical protein